jgi:hypothetical protein
LRDGVEAAVTGQIGLLQQRTELAQLDVPAGWSRSTSGGTKKRLSIAGSRITKSRKAATVMKLAAGGRRR